MMRRMPILMEVPIGMKELVIFECAFSLIACATHGSMAGWLIICVPVCTQRATKLLWRKVGVVHTLLHENWYQCRQPGTLCPT